MNEVTKLYENANIKPEYRYDCNLADTIKPVEVFPLHRCSKGEIKDYCTNKQDYRYCKVYKVNKIYPPFTAEKQIELIKWLLKNFDIDFSQIGQRIDTSLDGINCIGGIGSADTLENSLCMAVIDLWQDLTEEERKQIKEILE